MVEVPGRIPPDRAAPHLERQRISPEGGGARRRLPPGRAASGGLGRISPAGGYGRRRIPLGAAAADLARASGSPPAMTATVLGGIGGASRESAGDEVHEPRTGPCCHHDSTG